MSPEIQHLAWIAGKAVLLYATAIIGLRLGKRRILAELSLFDFVAAVAVGAIVGRIPSASDADYLAGAVTLIAVLFAHALVSHLRHYSSVARLVVDSDAKCNPVDSIGSSTKSRVSHSERRPSAWFPGDEDSSARRNIEPLQ